MVEGGRVRHRAVVVVVLVVVVRGGGGGRVVAHYARDGGTDGHRRADRVVQVLVDAVQVGARRGGRDAGHQVLQAERRVRQRLHAFHCGVGGGGGGRGAICGGAWWRAAALEQKAGADERRPLLCLWVELLLANFQKSSSRRWFLRPVCVSLAIWWIIVWEIKWKFNFIIFTYNTNSSTSSWVDCDFLVESGLKICKSD